MLLKKIKVENFRSLSKIEFEIGNYIVIFGKNNEGKSNVLKAVKRFWDILAILARSERRYSKKSGYKLRGSYFKSNTNKEDPNFEDDIPIEIMKLKRTKKTIEINITFELEDNEVEELNSLLTSTSKATNYLQVNITYNRELECNVSVKLKENGRSLSILKNVFIILRYLLDHFSIDYIPSIRTEEESLKIIESIISQKLRQLEESPQFTEALDKINELQAGLLTEISKTIEPDLQKYLNRVNSVEIVPLRQKLLRFIRNNNDIKIDDGKKTSLKDKGDGIKSLVALSLLQTSNRDNSLLMIDEPEVHLHSGAIKELERKIKDESNNQQVLIASHHQIFVDRNIYSNNLILSSGNLEKKVNIRKIREELGVGLGENLLNAEIIILVEGETDQTILNHYINLKDPYISRMIRDNKIVIDVLKGTKNLEAKMLFYKSGLCKVICLLDNDEAANGIVESVLNKNILDSQFLYQIPLIEQNSSEIEDLLNQDFAFSEVDNFFGVQNSIDRVGMGSKDKFTDKVVVILDSFGKKMEKKDKSKFKLHLSERILNFNDCSFISEKGKLFLNPVIQKLHDFV